MEIRMEHAANVVINHTQLTQKTNIDCSPTRGWL